MSLQTYRKNYVYPNYVFNTDEWIDKGTYWLHKAAQGTVEWKNIRKILYLLTGSNFASACGKSYFSSQEKLISVMLGKKIIEQNEHMKRGSQGEDAIRKWYMSTYNVKVEEVGLMVPKFDIRIGSSLDGIIGEDGCIEIKYAKVMYKKLKEHMINKHNGVVFPIGYHDHIFDSHYYQMQGGMAISNMKWCDYIVISQTEQISYVERIPFNENYWNDVMYPSMDNFLDNVLKPKLIEEGVIHE